MSRRQLPSHEDGSATDDPYSQWEHWAEEVWPEEEARMPDRVTGSSIRYRQQQERLDARRTKGLGGIPVREASPDVDVAREVEPDLNQ